MALPKAGLLAVVAVSVAALGGGAGVAHAFSINGNGDGGTNPKNNGAFAIPLGEFTGPNGGTCDVSVVTNKHGTFLEFEGDCFI